MANTKVNPDQLDMAITGLVADAGGWYEFRSGPVRYWCKRYTYEVGSVAADSQANLGTVNLPVGCTLANCWFFPRMRTSGNSPWFQLAVENNDFYLRNISPSAVDPGTITVDIMVVPAF